MAGIPNIENPIVKEDIVPIKEHPLVPSFPPVLPPDVKLKPVEIHDEHLEFGQPNNPAWREENRIYHEKHKGHDSMHASMIIVLFVTLIVAQILLVQWRRLHQRSYQIVTLFAMWIIPVCICVKFLWIRFVIIWAIFSLFNLYYYYISSRKPLAGTTPRRVYKWFLLIYKSSYILGLVGYVVIMAALFGFSLLFLVQPNVAMEFGLLLLFYGLYYGVIGRDLAEVCADMMASHLGYYTKGGMPVRKLERNVCAICGNRLAAEEVGRMKSQEELEKETREAAARQQMLAVQYQMAAQQYGYVYAPQPEDRTTLSDTFEAERTFRLACEHTFHEFCIRGWCMIGKKQTCPYCNEKVDLQHLFHSPWEKPHLLFGSLLDWIRYLVAWQPIIVGFVQCINWFFGLE